MKMFIILDMKKNKIDNFSLKIIVLTSIEYWPLKEYWLGRLKLPPFLPDSSPRPPPVHTPNSHFSVSLSGFNPGQVG
jgi:hypothetical protein